LINKDTQFKWGSLENEAFEKENCVIAIVPTLHNPDFEKDLFLYIFYSYHLLVVVLKNIIKIMNSHLFHEYRVTMS
jgi:hypothetical protein